MSEPVFSYGSIARSLFKNSLIRILFALTVLIELYDITALPAYLSTQKAHEAKAVADNASLRRKAEADLAEQKAINETQVAVNAKRKQLAEARKATALADKTRYEASLSGATSDYADTQAKYEAAAQEAQALLTKQAEEIQSTYNLYIERQKKAQADMAQLEAQEAALTNQLMNCHGIDIAQGRCGTSSNRSDQPDATERGQGDASIDHDSGPFHRGPLRVKSQLADGKLNMRDGPGQQHNVIAEIPLGTGNVRQLAACVRSDNAQSNYGWCKVQWNGTTGFISANGVDYAFEQPDSEFYGRCDRDYQGMDVAFCKAQVTGALQAGDRSLPVE